MEPETNELTYIPEDWERRYLQGEIKQKN